MDKEKKLLCFMLSPMNQELVENATASVFSFSQIHKISEEEALNILNIAIKANLEEKREENIASFNAFKKIFKDLASD